MNRSEKPKSNSNTNQISVNSARAWRNEAEEIGRSAKHLNKIDSVLSQSPIEKINNKKVINLSDRDLKAMQKDRKEFKEKYSQSQAQTSKGREGESIKNSYSLGNLKY